MTIRVSFIERTIYGTDYVDFDECESFEAGSQWVKIYQDASQTQLVAVINSSVVRMVERFNPSEEDTEERNGAFVQ